MALPTTGFGAAPFGLHPFGLPLEEFAEDTPTILRSSRKVNLVTGKYELDADGNFAGMDDVGQRMVLAIRSAVIPELQTLSFDQDVQLEVRRVLEPITSGAAPDASLITKNGTAPIVVVPRPNGVEITVFYKNNLVNSETSITITRG